MVAAAPAAPRIAFDVGPVYVGRQERRVPHSPLNVRMHWAQRNAWRKAWEQAVLWGALPLRAALRKPLPRARVTFTLSSIRPMDPDNAHASIKPLLDALKGVAIVDDAPDRLQLRVEQHRVLHKRGEGVRIEIEPWEGE